MFFLHILINSVNGLRIWLNLSRPAGEGVDAGGTLN